MKQELLLEKRKVDWSNLWNMNIASSHESFSFHCHLQLEILLQIKRKYKRKLNYQEVYTEYPINGFKLDVVHFNNSNGEKQCIIYEVQKDLNNKDYQKKMEILNNLQINGYNVWIVEVQVNEFSDSFHDMQEKIKEVLI